MLSLTRKVGQTISVGRGLVVIKVAKISGNKVQLSIEAPPEMRINRGEVELRMNEEERTDAA